MLTSLTNWLSWTTTQPVHTDQNTTSRPENEWMAWEVWQRSQPPSHFEKSEMFQYYLSCRPQFSHVKNSILLYENYIYQSYCFGDFSAIFVNPANVNISTVEAVRYCNFLLDFYDICKGITRRLTGDPSGIAVLREVVNKNTIIPLFKHDFNQYKYDYTILHAHTVCQYSLSTLLMRLLCNFLSRFTFEINFEEISMDRCKSAYENYNFGHPFVRNIEQILKNDKLVATNKLKFSQCSIPMGIPQKILLEEEKCSSWPRNLTCSRCSKCNRVSENLWGIFHCCIDCHMKRICSKCGITATVIGSDKLPKCESHK